jgi:hypothetical protein
MAGHPNSHAAGAAGGGRAKVIYVMGAGRSGSTILGVTLGNCAGVFFAGELNRWLPRSGIPPRGGTPRAAFWSGVRAKVDGAATLFGDQTTALERSSAMLDVRTWSRRRRLRRDYRRVSQKLYLAIQDQSGADYIVDSSHYPLRARALRQLEGVELYILYLVRDPQSVVTSMARTDVRERSFDLFTSNLYLSLTHLLSVFVFLRQPAHRRVFVRHEDFLADPHAVIGRILGLIGSPAEPPGSPSLQVGVPFHGNRLIDDDLVVLESRPAHHVEGSRVTTLVQFPWSLIFARLRPAASLRGSVQDSPGS